MSNQKYLEILNVVEEVENLITQVLEAEDEDKAYEAALLICKSVERLCRDIRLVEKE